ncbi:MAG: hypothetical protein PHY31_06460, partial [Smithellaceae bacterium]|nr:hypothetical protein [Smithellaceae bacterium]
ILHSSALFFSAVYFILMALSVLVVFSFLTREPTRKILMKPGWGLLLGMTVALEVFSHGLAISQVQAAYMIALKRTSLAFGVLYGFWIFKEDRMAERLAGSLIMLAGVFLIGWFAW